MVRVGDRGSTLLLRLWGGYDGTSTMAVASLGGRRWHAMAPPPGVLWVQYDHTDTDTDTDTDTETDTRTHARTVNTASTASVSAALKPSSGSA